MGDVQVGLKRPNNAPFVDIQAESFRFDQDDLFEAAREHWFARTELGPLVLRYDEACDILADRRLSPTGQGHLRVHGITGGPIHDYFSVNLSSRATVDHGRLRGLFAPYLTPRRLATIAPDIETAADRLCDRLVGPEHRDFVAEYASPLAIGVFSELIGLPLADVDRFGPPSADVGLVFGLRLDGVRDRVETAMVSLFDYFRELMQRRGQEPATDFVSALAALHAETGVDPQQCLSTMVSLIMGGHDAPMHQLGCAVAVLAEHPEQWDWLGRHPELASAAVEELLRWSAHTHTMRFAVEDFDYRDLHLDRGDVVITCNTVANRDPSAFADPLRLDISMRRSRTPIAFGGGPFFCPGHALAKLEISLALRALTRRFTAPELATGARWRPPVTTAYGPEYLPLRFSERN